MTIAELAAERDWTQIPGVQVVGGVIGILLVIAAIRAMFGKRR
jgi:hypothetical protein